MYIRPSDLYWLDPVKEAAKQFALGQWCTDQPHHVVIHELGHLAHYRQDAAAYRAALDKVWTAEELSIARRVSAYAAESPREFVAEVFVLLTLGKPIADDVLSLYQKLGGMQL